MPSKTINLEQKNGATYAKVKDLKLWKDNPKYTDGVDFKRLKRQLELGEHSPLLVTPEGEVLGGNQRLRAYKEAQREEAMIVLAELEKQDDGVHVRLNGIEAPRVFESEQQAKLELALSHNDQIGKTDEKKLANLLHVTPIDMEVYRVASVVRPVEDIAFEAGPAADPDERPQDESDVDTSKLDAYMNGNIKQIVLYFANEEYGNIMERLDAVQEKLGLNDETSRTDLFLAMLKHCEETA